MYVYMPPPLSSRPFPPSLLPPHPLSPPSLSDDDDAAVSGGLTVIDLDNLDRHLSSEGGPGQLVTSEALGGDGRNSAPCSLGSSCSECSELSFGDVMLGDPALADFVDSLAPRVSPPPAGSLPVESPAMEGGSVEGGSGSASVAGPSSSRSYRRKKSGRHVKRPAA